MSADKQILVFELDDNLYAFPISQVEEVIAMPTYTTAPNMPQYLLGVTNYKNNIVPIYSLEKIFAIDGERKCSLCLVVKSRFGLISYAIDAISGVRSLDKAVQVDERIRNLTGGLRIISTIQLAMQEKPVHILEN